MNFLLSGFDDYLKKLTMNFLLSGFDDYLKKLTPEQNERNFWFRDYWEDLFDCDVDQRSYEIRSGSHEIRSPRQQRKLCNPKLR